MSTDSIFGLGIVRSLTAVTFSTEFYLDIIMVAVT